MTETEWRAGWVPVRYVREDQKCSFCRARIPRGSPGPRTGERGTKGWWNKLTREWECLACRSEGVRAEEARDRWDEVARSAAPIVDGGEADVLVDRFGRCVSGSAKWGAAYASGEVGALRVRRVPDRVARELEEETCRRLRGRARERATASS